LILSLASGLDTESRFVVLLSLAKRSDDAGALFDFAESLMRNVASIERLGWIVALAEAGHHPRRLGEAAYALIAECTPATTEADSQTESATTDRYDKHGYLIVGRLALEDQSLDPAQQADFLIRLALGPLVEHHSRLLAEAESAASRCGWATRVELLARIATAGYDRRRLSSEIVGLLDDSASDFRLFPEVRKTRALALVAAARVGFESKRLLAEAEEIAAELDGSDRSNVLLALARAGADPRRIETLAGMARPHEDARDGRTPASIDLLIALANAHRDSDDLRAVQLLSLAWARATPHDLAQSTSAWRTSELVAATVGLDPSCATILAEWLTMHGPPPGAEDSPP
jgi:hypothetical protein